MKNPLIENLPYYLLRITLKCNANCLFCNVPFESFNYFSEPSTCQIKRKIKKLVKVNPKIKLSISGGEPTIREDLIELINYAKKIKIKTVEIQTNGILLSNKEYVKKLKEAGLDKAFVGLHSHLPKIHDYLVGVRGAFYKCIEGIKNLLNEEIKVIVNPVITTKNLKNLCEFILFIKKNFPQIQSISLSVVQPRGRAWVNKNLVPSYQIIHPFIKKALSLAEKIGIIVNNPYCGLPLCVGNWWKYLDRNVEFCEHYLEKINKNTKNLKMYYFSPREKIKTEKCLICDFTDFCNGVWIEYVKIHSFSGIKPIKLSFGEKHRLKQKFGINF
jgi:MoaA/NifB/PqqE/SkfB family radical SAM enzyme